MVKRIFFVFCILQIFVLQAQTRIKVMNFNLMHFPSTLVYDENSGTFVERTLVLKNILDTFQPDILAVCELESSEGADKILQIALETSDNRYNRGNFAVNQSTDDHSLQQLIFYNQQKLTMIDQDIITTNVRDINRYTFQLNASQENVLLDVFVTHLKSSSGSDNQQKRLQMVQQLTNYFDYLPPDRYVIFTGDFNLYHSDEPAYIEILDSDNNITLADPINTPGYWSNNSDFAHVHTQSPLTSRYHFQSSEGNWDGVTGGMDDRFDFIMLSQNMLYNQEALYYVSDTYKAYGNNGNCFNNSINSTDCAGDFSQDLRDLIFNMSDHIPVTLELETPYTLGVNTTSNDFSNLFLIPNVVEHFLEFNVSNGLINKKYSIRNNLGQVLFKATVRENFNRISIDGLNSGMYFIALEEEGIVEKFIKL